jgi:hypothetical protein
LSDAKERVKASAFTRSTLILSALVLSVAGCAGPTGSATSGPESDPYDIYRSHDLQTIDAAQKLGLYKCLAAEGFPQLLENDPDPEGADASEGLEFPDNLWFDSEEQARQNGFGHNEPGRRSTFRLKDPAYIAHIDSCMSSAWEALGADAERTIVTYAQLGNKLRGEAFTTINERIPEFRDRIYKCLQKEEAPVSQQADNEWGLSFNFTVGSLEGVEPKEIEGLQPGFSEAIPERKYIPTPKESEIAAQVHNCAVDTGVKKEVQELAYRDRKATIAKVETELTELNAKISDMAAKSAALRGQ